MMCFLACLLSALKAQNISWSPYLIRLALENTARLPKDQNRFAVGSGLLQVAFRFFKKISKNLPCKRLKFSIIRGNGFMLSAEVFKA